MQIKTGLLLTLGLSCLLLTAACVARQPQTASVSVPTNEQAAPDKGGHAEANTHDYIHGWTHPTGNDSGKPLSPGASKALRERMLSNETDSYKRAWTFPTEEGKTSEKSSAAADSRSDSPKVTPPDDTEEYLNGWTFE